MTYRVFGHLSNFETNIEELQTTSEQSIGPTTPEMLSLQCSSVLATGNYHSSMALR